MIERIALITDLHISLEEKYPFEIDTLYNFHKVINSIDNKVYCHIIVAGDLCFRKVDSEVYKRVFLTLNGTGIPFSVVPGNHDNSEAMAKVFGLNTRVNEIYYKKIICGKEFLFLDTSRGEMSERQWDWFEQEIMRFKNSDSNIFIVMHHPPMYGDSPHMDNAFGFKQIDVFKKIIREYSNKNKIYVFCGHYHIERYLSFENIHVFITPSLFVQIDPKSEKFNILTKRIAFREISFGQDGYLNTSVFYI